MTVSLRKAHHEPVRYDCDLEDVQFALDGRPLWWDDASYIAYQCDDGPDGEWIYELSFLPDARTQIVRRWFSYLDYEPRTLAPSRAVRTLLASFDAVVEPSPADAELVADATWNPPF